MERIDLRNVAVNYQYRSAHQVLWDMCLKLGVENVRAALDEIDAEQNMHPTGGESPVEVDLSTLENLPSNKFTHYPPFCGLRKPLGRPLARKKKGRQACLC